MIFRLFKPRNPGLSLSERIELYHWWIGVRWKLLRRKRHRQIERKMLGRA